MFYKLLLNRFSKTSSIGTMRVTPIPANQDNYQYLIQDEHSQIAAIVTPIELLSILDRAKAEAANLTMALVTYHHFWDHLDVGGTADLKKAMANVKIYGGDGERIEALDIVLEDGQQFQIGSLQVTALKTQCHTSKHICYYVEDKANNQRAVFTGDTLSVGGYGCGHFIWESAEQMHVALNGKLSALPDDTLFYCGHHLHGEPMLDNKFQASLKIVDKLLKASGLIQIPNDQKLKFYSLSRQAVMGNVRPRLLSILGREKWDAWKELEGMSTEEAKNKHVGALLETFDNTGEEVNISERLSKIDPSIKADLAFLGLGKPAAKTEVNNAQQGMKPDEQKPKPSASDCAVCGGPMQGSCVFAEGKRFHRDCFRCSKCKHTIHAEDGGDGLLLLRYHVRGGKILCAMCYAEAIA